MNFSWLDPPQKIKNAGLASLNDASEGSGKKPFYYCNILSTRQNLGQVISSSAIN